jgi:hypothetical protein
MKLPIETIDYVLKFLTPEDIARYLSTAKVLFCSFPQHTFISKQIHSLEIYKNEPLMKKVYSHYPNYVQEITDTSEKIHFRKRLVKMNSYEAFYGNIEHWDIGFEFESLILWNQECLTSKGAGIMGKFDPKFIWKIVSLNHLKVFNQIVDELDQDGLNEALRWAASEDKSLMLKYLLGRDVDPSNENNEAISRAANNGHVDICKLLLGDQRLVSSTGLDEALQFAYTAGHDECVKLFLDDDRIDPFMKVDYQL